MNDTTEHQGEYLRNEPCPKCSKTGEGKSLGVWTDGKYCNECGYTSQDTEEVEKVVKKDFPKLLDPGTPRAIPDRGITEDTMRKYKATIAKYKGMNVLCNNVYEDGCIVAQKIKMPKKFLEQNPKGPKCLWLGDSSKKPALWGMDLWEPNSKLSVTVCEGEPDMLCRSSLNGDKWPVVSLTDGAGPQAVKSIAKAKSYLLGFKHVNLMFDGDEAGRKTAQEAAALLGPKARIVQMPDGMDVCDLFKAGRASEVSTLEIRSVGFRPKDIVTVSDYTDEELYTKEARGVPLPFPELDRLIRGLKQPRLYMVCAGSGLGKSTIVKEIAYDLMFNQGIKVGCIFLEQGDTEAMRDYIAMDNYIEAEEFSENPDLVEADQRAKSKEVLADYAVFYKHFGSLDSKTLVDKIEYMMDGCGCEYVILDHISMAISGNTSTEGERKDIDMLMTNLRTLVQRSGKSVIAVSHLKRLPDAKDYGQGAKVTLSCLRGSSAIEQISDYVIALERNQFNEQAKDEVCLKVLKCRRGGKIGYADTLKYSHETGRLSVMDVKITEELDKDESNGESSLELFE